MCILHVCMCILHVCMYVYIKYESIKVHVN